MKVYRDKSLSAFDLLGVRFALFTIGVQYTLFLVAWMLPALQIDIEPSRRDVSKRRYGLVMLVSFHTAFFTMLWSFAKTTTTDPGRIPDTIEWTSQPNPLKLKERTVHGEYRFSGYVYFLLAAVIEPDRAHYCSNMGRCILRMDHYCPWAANGIGYYNYKYFFLTLLYANACLIMSTCAMAAEFFETWMDLRVPWDVVYYNFMGALLGGFLFCVLFTFFCFHVYLASKNLTTLEYMEIGQCRYDLGNWLENYGEMFGPNTHQWLMPIGGPEGEGLSFPQQKVKKYKKSSSGIIQV